MRAIIFALGLSAISSAASAQSQTYDPPTARDIVDALGGNADNQIYNLNCGRVDYRTFICDFDMPPESRIPHVSVQAVWVGSGWSITIRH